MLAFLHLVPHLLKKIQSLQLRDGARPHHGIPASPIISLIGQPPPVRLTRVAEGLLSTAALYVKVEGLNSGGSVNDRAALSIIREVLRTGALAPGKTLVGISNCRWTVSYHFPRLGYFLKSTRACC
ncbi:MAG: hypothetical protein U9R15_07060 [Chloroflexota bacterium]|nr:hypothetical protein [Chloroflexota bacterium]